jgi:hypothetical protein
MALRLHRVNDDTWRRLARARRKPDLAASPARASIGAIEIEIRALVERESQFHTGNRRTATG